MESERNFQPKPERPKFVYHGSIADDIQEFEPRTRYTPGGREAPPRVYAAEHPAFAAAHAFPWHSKEGIDVMVSEGHVTLFVPEQHKQRLEQPVFVYKLSGDLFERTEDEKTGQTYHSEDRIAPDEVQRFDSVTEAIEYFGGRVEIVDENER